MAITVTLLPGLPAYGPMAIPFPAEWGRSGREGTIVGICADGESPWTANFRHGFGGINLAAVHPNKKEVVVIAEGDLWIVDPVQRTATLSNLTIFAAWEVHSPDGWIFSRQDITFVRLCANGILWQTKRLSIDGFDRLTIGSNAIEGFADALGDRWEPFRVDLATGRSTGGSYPLDDAVEWEKLYSSGAM